MESRHLAEPKTIPPLQWQCISSLICCLLCHSPKTSSRKSGQPKRKRLAKAQKNMILKSQNFKCAMCGCDISKITPHYDHRIPLAIGGSNNITNIQALCGTCHTEKSKYDKLEIARSKSR